MRNETVVLEEAICIEDMKNHGLEVGMQVEVTERKAYARPERENKDTKVLHRRIKGEVLAVNDRIFTLKTETFRRIESFHLSDTMAKGSLKVKVMA